MARRRLDLRGAAEVLGTSVDAVRKRIARGTLESEKADGKVYVWLDDGAPRSDADALISSKDETIAVLREQLEAERQAHAEARRIIAGLVERVPALEAPHEPESASEPHPSTTAPPEPERTEPRPGATDTQEHDTSVLATWTSDVQDREGARRPWWRRIFGG